jgi:hypothetical protein
VSPQFHVKYDDNFETIRSDCHQPRSKWQAVCVFEPGVTVPESAVVVDIPVIAMPDQHPVLVPYTPESDANHPQIKIEVVVDHMEGERDLRPTNIGEVPCAEEIPRMDEIQTAVNTTRSGRVVRTPSKYSDYVALVSEVEDTLCVEAATTYDHPLAMAASSDPDVLYMHEALAAPDKREFIKAMELEIRAHTENAN